MKVFTITVLSCLAALANGQPVAESECSSLAEIRDSFNSTSLHGFANSTALSDLQPRSNLRHRLCNEDRDCKGKCVCGIIWPDKGTGICVKKKDKALLEMVQRENAEASPKQGPVYPHGPNAGFYGLNKPLDQAQPIPPQQHHAYVGTPWGPAPIPIPIPAPIPIPIPAGGAAAAAPAPIILNQPAPVAAAGAQAVPTPHVVVPPSELPAAVAEALAEGEPKDKE
jgi:hypothetical protein